MTKTDGEVIKLGEPCVASFGFEMVKAEEVEGGETGKVTALVSAYNVEYRMGGFAKPIMHFIHNGAFEASIEGNASVPVFWQHNWDHSARPPIGTATATEKGRGLMVEAEFFLDTEDGRSVYNAIKAGAIREWSIGYRILQADVDESDEDKTVVHIKEAELLEASSVLRGANPETDTLKVARQLPEDIQEALDSIAKFMQAQKTLNDQLNERLEALADRFEGLEVAHGILVDSFEEMKGEEPEGVGSEVEHADGGSGDSGDARSSSPEETPSSADGVAAEGQSDSGVQADSSPDSPDLDALFENVTQRVVAGLKEEVERKKQEIVDRAGRILPPGEEGDVRDLEALTRVLQVTNKVNSMWESSERFAEIGVLAANRAVPEDDEA